MPNTIGRVMLFDSFGVAHWTDLSFLLQVFDDVDELSEEPLFERFGS